jgi:hypothetical protein
MVQAGEKEWVEIEGIGKPMAKKIMAALRGVKAMAGAGDHP